MRVRHPFLFASLSLALVGTACAPTKPASSEPATVTTRAPEAPPSGAARSSGIVFTVAYQALVPVGCYDDKRGKWGTAGECFEMLSMIKGGASVALESGRVAKITGKRVPTIADCSLPTALPIFENPSAEPAGNWAVWPPKADGRVRRIPWDSTKKGADVLSPADRERLGAAMHKLAPVDIARVVQTATADLDSDGTSEIFFSIHGTGFDPIARKGLSVLFYGPVSGGPLTALRSSDHAVYRLEGVVDVDQDGVSEAWISERTFHETGMRTDSMTLLHRDGSSLAPLPAVESCWPIAKAKHGE